MSTSSSTSSAPSSGPSSGPSLSPSANAWPLLFDSAGRLTFNGGGGDALRFQAYYGRYYPGTPTYSSGSSGPIYSLPYNVPQPAGLAVYGVRVYSGSDDPRYANGVELATYSPYPIMPGQAYPHTFNAGDFLYPTAVPGGPGFCADKALGGTWHNPMCGMQVQLTIAGCGPFTCPGVDGTNRTVTVNPGVVTVNAVVGLYQGNVDFSLRSYQGYGVLAGGLTAIPITSSSSSSGASSTNSSSASNSAYQYDVAYYVMATEAGSAIDPAYTYSTSNSTRTVASVYTTLRVGFVVLPPKPPTPAWVPNCPSLIVPQRLTTVGEVDNGVFFPSGLIFANDVRGGPFSGDPAYFTTQATSGSPAQKYPKPCVLTVYPGVADRFGTLTGELVASVPGQVVPPPVLTAGAAGPNEGGIQFDGTVEPVSGAGLQDCVNYPPPCPLVTKIVLTPLFGTCDASTGGTTFATVQCDNSTGVGFNGTGLYSTSTPINYWCSSSVSSSAPSSSSSSSSGSISTGTGGTGGTGGTSTNSSSASVASSASTAAGSTNASAGSTAVSSLGTTSVAGSNASGGASTVSAYNSSVGSVTNSSSGSADPGQTGLPANCNTHLTGTPLSSAAAAGSPATDAFDGDFATAFVASGTAGNYLTLDLGDLYYISAIDYAPRAGHAADLSYARFFGSQTQPTFDPNNDGSAGTFAEVDPNNLPPDGQYTDADFADPPDEGSYRYVGVQFPDGQSASIAELRIYGCLASAYQP